MSFVIKLFKLIVGFCWVLLDFVGFCWVLLGFVGLCWVLLGFVGLCLESKGDSQVIFFFIEKKVL